MEKILIKKSKLYQVNQPKLAAFNYVQLSGKALSFNNLVDTESAYSCVEQFVDPSCVQLNMLIHVELPVKNLEQSYNYAYKTDPTSAFGGIITFNRKVNSKLITNIIKRQFVEVIAAPSFDKKSLDVLKKSPTYGFLKLNQKNKNDKVYETKLLRDKLLIQEKDEKELKKSALKIVTKKKPTPNQLNDMLFAFKVSRYVKSNSIVFVKNKKLLQLVQDK